MVERARILIHARHDGGATKHGNGLAWSVAWHSENLVLIGHLYTAGRGRPDEQSPLVLLDRFSRTDTDRRVTAVYGPDLPHLGYALLAFSLAYDQVDRRESAGV